MATDAVEGRSFVLLFRVLVVRTDHWNSIRFKFKLQRDPPMTIIAPDNQIIKIYLKK